MRLHAVVLVTWAVIITASSQADISDSSDEPAADHAESRDSPARQIVQPYVTGIEARSSGQTGTEDHSNDIANAGLSGPAAARNGERGSEDGATTDSPSTAIYVTPLTGTARDTYPFGEHLDLSESGYVIPEDVLVVENAGSFGQKVRQGNQPADKMAARDTNHRTQHDDYASYRKSFSSTVSFLQDKGDRRKFQVSATRKPLKEMLKGEHDSTGGSSSTEPKTIRLETKTWMSDDIPGPAVTFDTRRLLDRKNNVAPAENESEIPLRWRARPPQRHNDTADRGTKKFAESIGERSESDITRTSTSVEISPSLHPLGGFSGPIVVPDLPAEEIRDVAVDYLDDNLDASGVRSYAKDNEKTGLEVDARDSKVATSNGLTMSSIMLKPLQVGITLVNAGEAALAVDNDQSAATDTDYLQDDLQRLAIADQGLAEYKGNQSRHKGDENFPRVETGQPVEAVTQKAVLDNSVEIQKSVELFHTAPVHEIHYPVEYIQQTSNLGIVDVHRFANAHRWKQSHDQEERSESQTNHDVYQGNDQGGVEGNVIKAHASTLSQRYNRPEYGVSDNKLATSGLYSAEYSPSTREQTPSELTNSQLPFRYNGVQPLLLIPNQLGDSPSRARPVENSARQEAPSKYAKTYISSTYRAQPQPQPIDQTAIDQQHPFRSAETRRPEVPQQQLLLKIVPHGSAGDGGFLVPLPRPYPVEKLVEKTVHVPHPVEVEKAIGKPVPFPVERVVERPVQVPVQVQAPVPVPVTQSSYPVHLQVLPERHFRVQHLYPIAVERRPPSYAALVQRPQLPQPLAYPLHVRHPTAYPATHAPAEKTAEKSVVVATASRPVRPYRADLPKQQVSMDGSSPIDITFDKYRQKPNGESILENVVPRGSPGEPAGKPSEANPPSRFHHGEPGYATGRPLAAYNYISTPYYSDVRLMILPRGYNAGHVAVTSRPHVVSSLYAVPVSVRRQIAYNLVEKDGPTKGDEYLGPVPLAQKNVPRSKTRSPAQYPANVAQPAQQPATTTALLRKSRQPEARYPGSFRQSKMEYGFKPPMIPSVQYDENAATKVDN